MVPILNKSLKNQNTFGFDVKAKQYFEIQEEKELRQILEKCYSDELFVLGGGSNILLTKDLNLTVLHINLKGIEVINKSQSHVLVRAKAGENWHAFVRYCIDQDFGGLENLSLIPGNVGTAPIQNIGAYGVELKDTFVECQAIHRQTLETRIFTNVDCKFGYRNSVFKNEFKDQYVITSVVFRLTNGFHQLHTSYGSIKEELKIMKIKYPDIRDISDAVIRIRESKLPDPKKLGNSGSFFKNPIIPKEQFLDLQKEFPEIRSYPVTDKLIKVPAGWLIDHAGMKGYRDGDAGVHKRQALVLVNYGTATGKDILALARKIQAKIKKKYGISLEMEVNLIE